jgi:hypothetical protein
LISLFLQRLFEDMPVESIAAPAIAQQLSVINGFDGL